MVKTTYFFGKKAPNENINCVCIVIIVLHLVRKIKTITHKYSQNSINAKKKEKGCFTPEDIEGFSDDDYDDDDESIEEDLNKRNLNTS